jgi:type II secretory pathway predicted ATPase ExeA
MSTAQPAKTATTITKPWLVVAETEIDPLDEVIITVGAAREDESETRPEVTIGRVEAITAINNFMARGRHVLITGSRGTGKSHLLRHVVRELVTGPTLVLDDFKAQKSILIDVCEELHEAGHLSRYQDESDPDKVAATLRRLRIGELTDLVASSLRGRGYIVIIDSLETLTPSGVPTLQALSENAVVVAACELDELDRLDPVVDRFNQVELGPMPPDEIKAILWSRLDQAEVADPAMLERRVIAQAAGLPGAIVDAAHKLAGSASLADIRGVTPTGARSAKNYADLTWIILIALAGVIAMRYIARSTDSTTGYVVFGVLSAFGLVVRTLLFRFNR